MRAASCSTKMGVGIGFRPELAAELLAAPGSVDFVEVVAEACRDQRARREVVALSEVWPIVPHGVKLSLGSACGIDDARVSYLAKLARDVKAPVVSEHVAFVRAGGREIGHLTELPMTRDAVRVVARNVDRLRRALPDIPLLLENAARGLVWPHPGEMTEGDFYVEVVRATGCDLLLDVANVYANARNTGVEPTVLLGSYPLDRVGMVHVAGGLEEYGFYFDTHAHPVPDAVFDLVAYAGCGSVMLERDASFDASVLREVARLRAIAAAAGSAPRVAESVVGDGDVADVPTETTELAEGQAALAEALTATTPTADLAIGRARSVLARKRAAEALALLPELYGRIGAAEAVELGRIRHTPRSPRHTTLADAIRIARAARECPDLAASARLDLATLSAQFGARSDEPPARGDPWRTMVQAFESWREAVR